MAGGQGTVFGKYFLLKKIASGGMGEIFLAKLRGPVGFEKLVVIKRILQHHLENQEFVDMFFAEARVAAQLTHSNIVQIYEMGDIDECYYIGMEYVHGKSLRDVLEAARSRNEYIHPAHAIEIISKVCQGMAYAHNATNMSGEAIGVIHRDLNPQNVLVSYSGEVKIIDFGIAKSQMQQHKTETGTIKGKFVYMSPEQSAAEPLDARSDQFAIGICLYEALTSVNPFAKDNVVLSLDAIQRQNPPPLSDYNPMLAPLDSLIATVLAKRREDRFNDCAQLGDVLQGIKDSVLDSAPVSLSDYMHDLFATQIDYEKRVILDSDSANSSQILAMQRGLERDQSGPHGAYRLKTPHPAPVPGQSWGSFTPHEPPPEPHSRLPFFLIFAAILIVSFVAAAVVFKNLNAPHETAVAAATEINPTPTTNLPVPAADPLPPESAADERTETSEPTGDPAATAVTETPESKQPGTSRMRKRRGGKPTMSPNPPHTENGASSPAEPLSPDTPSPARFGTLQVSTVPSVQIKLGGRIVGQTFKLDAATGKLVFGSGQSGPFTVSIRYRVVDDDITFAIESEPWAIVRGNGGIGLGRTPLKGQKSSGRDVFELVNPKEQRSLRITLGFTR